MADQEKLIKILGTKELANLFNEMEYKLQNTILNKSFKKGAKIIQDQAKSNLQGYPGIKSNFKITFKKDVQTAQVRIKNTKSSFMKYWVEHGTEERFYVTKKNGVKKSVGRIKGQKFFSRAVESTKSDVQKLIYTDIQKEFNNLIKKNNKLK